MAKKLLQKNNKLEKVLIIAGFTLLLTTLVATLFGIWNNQQFIYDGFGVVYYYRYLIMLGGGFLVGYIISRLKQPKAPQSPAHFSGITYGLLTYIVFNLLDVVRVIVVNPIETIPFPWGKIIFEGMPLLALLIVLIVGLFATRKTVGPNRVLSWVVVLAFVIQQVSVLASGAVPYLNIVLSGNTDWKVLLGIVTTPLFIALAAYLFLGRVKDFLARAFYASWIGALFSTLLIVLWEFRTNPEGGVTEIFGWVVLACSLVFTAVVVWFAHRAAR